MRDAAFALFAVLALSALWQISRQLAETNKQLRLIKWWIAHGQGESIDARF